MLSMVLSFAVILLAALLMSYAMLKRTEKSEGWGCLTYVAFLAGIAVVLFLLWPSPSTLIAGLLVLGATMLCVSVVSLAATGWRTLLAPYVKAVQSEPKRRRKTPNKEKELDEQFAVETFEGAFSMNPLSLMESQFGLGGRSTTTSTSGDPLDSCIGSILIGIVVSISYLGVLFSYALSAFLMPRPTSPTRRTARIVLCFLYAAAIFVGVSWLLNLPIT